MQRSQPFAQMMTPKRASQPAVPNFAIYALIALFLLVFWLTVVMVVV